MSNDPRCPSRPDWTDSHLRSTCANPPASTVRCRPRPSCRGCRTLPCLPSEGGPVRANRPPRRPKCRSTTPPPLLPERRTQSSQPSAHRLKDGARTSTGERARLRLRATGPLRRPVPRAGRALLALPAANGPTHSRPRQPTRPKARPVTMTDQRRSGPICPISTCTSLATHPIGACRLPFRATRLTTCQPPHTDPTSRPQADTSQPQPPQAARTASRPGSRACSQHSRTRPGRSTTSLPNRHLSLRSSAAEAKCSRSSTGRSTTRTCACSRATATTGPSLAFLPCLFDLTSSLAPRSCRLARGSYSEERRVREGCEA